MKCPHCNYEDGWSSELCNAIEGSEGEFYRLPIKLERKSIYYERMHDVVSLHACPSCMKTFVEKD